MHPKVYRLYTYKKEKKEPLNQSLTNLQKPQRKEGWSKKKKRKNP